MSEAQRWIGPDDADGSEPVAGRCSPGASGTDQQPGGLSWCWDMDLAAVLEAVCGVAPWLREHSPEDGPQADSAPAADSPAANSPPTAGEAPASTSDPAATTSRTSSAAPTAPACGDGVDVEAEETAYQEAIAAGRAWEIPVEMVAGRVAESLPPGPALAGWLTQARAADLEDGALAGVAASFRRVASWAAAGELAAVAQIASRSAKADRRVSVDPGGRPDRLTGDAVGQVALALALSPDGASSWTDLAVVLTWRLTATGAALAAGQIDLARARMIARMTGALDDRAARAVEAAVLDRAGWQTLGQLHDALRRAVIKADPDGAERRRKHAREIAVPVGTAESPGESLPSPGDSLRSGLAPPTTSN